MGTSVFPSLPGEMFPVTRTPSWDTTVQQNLSGKEVRIANSTYPRWKWELSFSVLRSAAAYTEFQQLAGFFNALQGSFDTFQYQDADDNAVTGQTIGTGDGTTTAFQLVRAFGGFIEPVLAPNNLSAVYLNGINTPSTPLSAPGAPGLSSSSAGALGATTYYVKTTWVSVNGETLGGTQASLAVAANKVLTVNQPSSPPPSAAEWRVYVSNTAGGGSGLGTLQTTLGIRSEEPHLAEGGRA